MKYIHLIVLFSLLSFLSKLSFAQPKGKYIPTKYDSVKKKVPPQIYGNKVRTDTIKTEAPIIIEPSIKPDTKVEKENIKSSDSIPLIKDIPQQNQPKKKKTSSEKDTSTKKEVQQTSPEKPTTIDERATDGRKSPLNKQPGKWSLQECIAYALENNLQITESELNERLARLEMQQNKYARLPSLNGDASLGESYGRSIDPTSNQFVTSGFIYNTLGLSSQTLLFGWFQRRHQIAQSQFELEAANSAYEQLKNDISLNVATGFLRVLLAREQVKINQGQLKLDNEQYDQTVKFANAGKVPELNVAQMLSQVATDSSNLVTAIANEQIAMLQLRALMNFDYEEEFDIVAPSIEAAELSALLELPDANGIFSLALKNQHQMKFNELKLLSAQKSLAIARSAQYPQLALIGSLGTNFSSLNKNITGQTYVGDVPFGTIKIGDTQYPLSRPDYDFQLQTRPILNQYSDNIRANIGLALSIPILNGFSSNTTIQKAKIGLIARQVSYDRDKLKLKQDIYQAYQETNAAAQKYNASRKAQDASKRAMDFAAKRYEIGMINTFEYTSTLNAYYTASSTVLSSKYDLIFKLKVLDYYMGNPIKL